MNHDDRDILDLLPQYRVTLRVDDPDLSALNEPGLIAGVAELRGVAAPEAQAACEAALARIGGVRLAITHEGGNRGDGRRRAYVMHALCVPREYVMPQS